MPRPMSARVGRTRTRRGPSAASDAGTRWKSAVPTAQSPTNATTRTWPEPLTPSQSTTLATAAPARPPRLKSPWNDDMIGRP